MSNGVHRCPHCNAAFTVSDLLDGDDIVTCPACESKFSIDIVLGKEPEIKIEELKSKTELTKKKVEGNYELEKLKLEQKQKSSDANKEVAISLITKIFVLVVLITIFFMVRAEVREFNSCLFRLCGR